MDDATPSGSPAATPPTPQQLRELRERAQALLVEQREQARQLEDKMTGELTRVSEQISQAYASSHEEASREAEAEIEQLRASLQAETDRQQEQADDLAKRAELVTQEEESLEQRVAEFEATREQRTQSVVALQVERDTLLERVARLEADLAATAHATANGADFENERNEWDAERAAMEAERVAMETDREALVAERDALAHAAQETEQRLAASAEQLQALEAGQSEANELQQKFDLALGDVQTLRARVAELEQELATRPAADAEQSAELAQLRAERDELRVEVAELEARPTGGGTDSEEVEDLRRRFELAVEDVRQLKTANAELQEQLANAAPATSVTDDGGQDWESQKRRMLASLEGGDEDLTPAQSEERATIEGTIRITDEIVAEKDAQIAQLLEQLNNEATAPVDSNHVADLGPSMDDDQRLAAERERLAKLEKEWEDKLRCAELELSVERAKIAREQAELAELRIDIETQRKSGGGHPRSESAPPQRNWLNKLGLGGGGEE